LTILSGIRIGGLVADSARVVLAGPEMAHLDQPLDVYGVIIGLNFLRRFRVTFDYASRLLILESYSK